MMVRQRSTKYSPYVVWSGHRSGAVRAVLGRVEYLLRIVVHTKLGIRFPLEKPVVRIALRRV